MLWAIVKPVKRPESQFAQFRKRIPLDVLPKVRGKMVILKIGDEVTYRRISERAQEIKVSLRTADPGEVKERQANVAAQLERHWRAIRSGPQRLTHKQVVSLAGEIYKLVVDVYEDDPETPENWDAVIEANRRSREGLWPLHIGSTEARVRKGHEHAFGAFVDFVLSRRSLEIDDESRDRLLRKAGEFLDRAAERLKRNAEGDYSTDVLRKGFPSWTSAAPKRGAARASTQPRVSLQKLFDDWWAESKAVGLSEATRDSYGHVIRKLGKFLKHDDAARITPEDIVAFKDARLKEINPRTGKLVSPKTVKDSDLVGLKAVFGWGVNNRRLTSNPAKGITVRVPRPVKKRDRSFSDEEAQLILGLAQNYQPGRRERPKLTAAKRWVPWLCAYTGARVGEMVQLRKQDVRKDAGGWYIRITPEAGRVKDKDMRDVPLHPHLIEQGFIAFVEAASDDRLFVTPAADGAITASWNTTKTRLAEFARKVVSDPDVQPNHAWRHRFLTEGRRVGVPERVLHEITGHAPANVGEAYGEVPLSVMREGIEKFPTYSV